MYVRHARARVSQPDEIENETVTECVVIEGWRRRQRLLWVGYAIEEKSSSGWRGGTGAGHGKRAADAAVPYPHHVRRRRRRQNYRARNTIDCDEKRATDFRLNLMARNWQQRFILIVPCWLLSFVDLFINVFRQKKKTNATDTRHAILFLVLRPTVCNTWPWWCNHRLFYKLILHNL